MNRTATILGLAAALALVAVLVGTRHPARTDAPPSVPVSAPPAPIATPAPTMGGSLSLVGRISHPVIPVGRSSVFLTADVTGAVDASTQRSPVDLALVIDRSGSMQGKNMEDAKAAARALVAQLRPTDRLSILHYGSDVRVLSGRFADPAGKEAMIAFIDAIQVDGGTNISAALRRARAALSGSDATVRRAILISDGVPTEGDTEPSHLLRLADALHASGISVSAIGVGLDFNENLMAGLAEHGSGAYGYLEDTSALASLFERDLQQAARTVAKGVSLQLTLPEGVSLSEVFGRPYTQEGRTVRVHLPDISSGQLERVVVQVSVTGRAAGERLEVADLSLNWQDVKAERAASTQTAIAAEVSARHEEVLARRDARAVVDATRAQAAANLEQAAKEAREGNHEKARGFLQKNQALYSEAEELAGAPVMKDEAQWERKSMAVFGSAAPAPAAMESTLKAAKVRARSNYGQVGSTY
jgi:Ca-activated chloride channel family protein